jgi:hypothetical protein
MRTVHARVSSTAQRQIPDIGHAAWGGLLDPGKGARQPAHEFLDGEAASARAPIGVDLVAVSFKGQGDRPQKRPARVGTPRQAT